MGKFMETDCRLLLVEAWGGDGKKALRWVMNFLGNDENVLGLDKWCYCTTW
jgi:hypothetical protein